MTSFENQDPASFMMGKHLIRTGLKLKRDLFKDSLAFVWQPCL